MWKSRLINTVPVVLSLLGSVGCFVIGAVEVSNAFLVFMRLPFTAKSVAAKTIDFELNNATDLLALCGSVAMLPLIT